jgi:endonuclease III
VNPVGPPLVHALRDFYGLQPTPPADLFQFFVWEILSENALPARRDLAWQALRRLPALTPDAMFRVPVTDLADAISLAGPHREEKVDRIRALVGDFKRHRDALSSEALTKASTLTVARILRRLDRVSPATRARALLFAVGRTVLPVDADVHRVASRLIGTPGRRRRGTVRGWLGERLPRDAATYRDAVIYLRHHAHRTCINVAPHCGVCPLRRDCRSVERSHTAS